jgi:hypothetical protein
MSPTLKRESVRSFETTVNFYQPIWRHALEEAFFSQHRGKPKFQKLVMSKVASLVRSLSFVKLPKRLFEKI